MNKFNKIFLFFFLISTLANSQGLIDTLKKRLSNAKNDSSRIEILYRFSINKKFSNKTGDSLRNSLSEFTKSTSCRIRSMAFGRLGSYADVSNDKEAAIKVLLKALKVAEECDDYWAIERAYYKIGFINYKLKNYITAISDFRSALLFSLKTDVIIDQADATNMLGVVYNHKGNSDSALYYAFESLKIYQKLDHKKNVAATFNTIGLIYKGSKNYESAIEYLQKSLKMRIESADISGQAACNINLANSYRETGNLKLALSHAKKGTALANDSKDGEYYRNGINSLALITFKMQDYKTSAMYYQQHKKIDDSLRSKVIDKNLQELQAKYESDKKDSELKRKEGDIHLQETRNRMKNILIAFAGLAVALSIVAIIFIFRSYKRSKRNANDLALKNKVIAEKNKEITDSINYAKNIQQSLLSGEVVFKEAVNDFFILFNPKDIVSGDFYWAKKVSGGFMVMCADCTGHGVPGAFMSLLGISHLNEITGTLNVHRPDLVLNELRKSLINGFGLRDNKDGMDAAFIKIQGQQLEMAAANNPVWVIRNKVNLVIKPNKFPIGKHHGEMQDFTLNTFETQQNDLIIMLTDGYADQFGGPKNKKFKYKNLEQIIIQNAHIPLKELKEILYNEITSWKGRNEQVDDILVIGIRV